MYFHNRKETKLFTKGGVLAEHLPGGTGLTKTLRVNDAGLTHGLMRLHHEERPPTDEWVNQALIVERRV